MARTRLDPGYAWNAREQSYGYPTASLAELVSEEPAYGTSSRAVPRTSEDQPRYIRITDYGADGIRLPHEFVAADAWDDKHLLAPGDILFARSGATVGKTYLHVQAFDPAVFAGYCIRFRIGSRALPEFVYAFTKTPAYAAWVAAIQRPAGQPNINKEEFKSLQIPVPPIDTQRRLVQELEAARAARDQDLSSSEQLLRSLDDVVRDELALPDAPHHERTGYAVRISQARAARSFSADYFHPERILALRVIERVPHAPLAKLVSFERSVLREPGEHRYIGLASVASHTGQLTDEEEQASGQCFAFEEGDVLYGRLRPYLNKVWCATFSGVCSTEFHVMRPLQASLRPEYLAVVMRTRLILSQTKHMMTGNTHPRIANEDVTNLLLPLCDEDTQESIVQRVRDSEDEANRLRARADALWADALARFTNQLLGGGAT